MGAVSPLTPARSRVRGLAGPCIALTALTGAGMRPLRLLLRRFLGARAMRCRTALLSPPASASRVTAMGGVWTRPVAGAARFNTALSSPLSPLPSPSRPVVGGFLFDSFSFFHAPASKERESTACFFFPADCPYSPALLTGLAHRLCSLPPLAALAHCQEHQKHQERAQQDKRFYVLFSG